MANRKTFVFIKDGKRQNMGNGKISSKKNNKSQKRENSLGVVIQSQDFSIIDLLSRYPKFYAHKRSPIHIKNTFFQFF